MHVPAAQAVVQDAVLTHAGVPVAVQSATHFSTQVWPGFGDVSVDSLRQNGRAGRWPSLRPLLPIQLRYRLKSPTLQADHLVGEVV